MSDINCPECGNKVKQEGYESYCVHCGLVVEETNIMFVAEKFSDKEGNLVSQNGPPFKWADPLSGTYSMIGNWKEYGQWKRKKRGRWW